MSKEQITRNSLKSSFLKQTIIKVDYDYLFDDYINEVMKKIDSFLGERGYVIENKYMSEFGLKVDFERLNNDENANFLDNINLEKDKREKYYSFTNNDKRIRIDITKEYFAITVDYLEYIPFEELNELYEKIMEELKNVRSNIKIKRVGLRKFNIYMMKNIEDIGNFFEDDIFSFASKNLNSYSFLGKSSLDIYSYNGYKVNQTANIAQGYMSTDTEETTTVYQLILDFDVYVDQIEKDVSLTDMNDNLFSIYKNSLKEDFLIRLKENNFKDERIFKL